ncbi:uncharacterized protein B0T23DRAFT_368617 [Neurospora hispaniola]|uniref:Uncharacterized protein n=1 Tax=Neurospora hispaniola TaxID=588809 RepID=A0AAJ0IEC6_9PEZI|nr:hypothetical protein B0T23DRAFT_368617 [Neurospora hispaniola]
MIGLAIIIGTLLLLCSLPELAEPKRTCWQAKWWPNLAETSLTSNMPCRGKKWNWNSRVHSSMFQRKPCETFPHRR